MRFGPLGLAEIIAILLVVLLLFGAKRLPDIAKGLGQSVREFRKGIRDAQNEIQQSLNEDESKTVNTASAAATTNASEKATEKVAS